MKKLRWGAFILLALSVASITQAATDVGPYYWVLKRADYVQTSTANPVLAGAPFHFNSVVERATNGNLTTENSFITPPGSGLVNTPQPYTVLPDGSLTFDSYVASASNLDTAYGSGGYLLDIRGSQGEWLPNLHLIGSSSFPPERPKITNTPFSNGDLVVNRTMPFTLRWNSFASHDFVDDLIVLTVSQGTNPIVRDVLPSTATARAFPANFFAGEQTYTIELAFVKVVETNGPSVPGSVGFAGFASVTRVIMSTSARTPINGLANISTRGMVGTGENVLIAGFVLTSTDNHPLRVIIRAIGPSLSQSGIDSPLQDPILNLFDGNNQLIATNDDWRTTASVGQITGSGLQPMDDRESALFRSLAPGAYTAVMQGKNDGTGVGLVEVYNLASFGQTKPINIATRGQVLTNDKVLIGGFVIQGAFSHNILIKATGPSLAAHGVNGVLANPTLQLVDAQGTTIATNDNWRASQEAAIEATGLQPTDDKESAILRPMGAGSYTAIVRGKNNGTGVALVSVDAIN